MAATHPSIEKFRRHTNAAYTSMNRPRGRNANATEETVRYHVAAAGSIFSEACADEMNPLPEYLDGPGSRLAEKWNDVERYVAGLPAILR